MAKAFDLTNIAKVEVTARTAGGNAAELTATSESGQTAVIKRAETIRAKLELRSAHINAIGWR
jgi:hypothetical protein